MNFELNFEELQKKLRKILNPSRFRFVIILYPNTNTIQDIKEYISKTYQDAKSIDLQLEDKSYQDIASDIYQENSFVYIDDFEEVLDNPDLYSGLNQRRDKIASHNINLICFLSLYKKDELFTKALNVIPDLWEFKNTVLELEKDDESDKLKDIKVESTSSYSSFGGLTTKDKEIELDKLLQKLEETTNDLLKENILFQIGTIYKDIGHYKNSLNYFLQHLKIKEYLEVSDIEMAQCYNNLATVYQSIGEIGKALEYQKKDIEITEKMLGIKHHSLAASYNNMSLIYLDIKDLEKALEYQKKALKIRESVLEAKDPDLAQSYNNISTIYLNKKDFRKALEFQNKALEIRKEVLGHKHPNLATSYNNLSQIYQEMGEFEKALYYQKKDMEIIKEVLGYNHPDLAVNYNNISLIYIRLKECKKAKVYLEKCLDIVEKLNYIHPKYLIIKDNLKMIENQIKKQKKAGFKKIGKYCKEI